MDAQEITDSINHIGIIPLGLIGININLRFNVFATADVELCFLFITEDNLSNVIIIPGIYDMVMENVD